jgi:hypothetical protein
VDYIILEDTDISQSVWEEATLQENDDDMNAKRIRMDVIVAHLSGMTAPGSNSLRFPRLSRVLQLIMIIPHSNADEERVFSLIRKNKTCFRPNLDPDITLQNLIMVKLAIPKPCQDYETRWFCFVTGEKSHLDLQQGPQKLNRLMLTFLKLVVLPEINIVGINYLIKFVQFCCEISILALQYHTQQYHSFPEGLSLETYPQGNISEG